MQERRIDDTIGKIVRDVTIGVLVVIVAAIIMKANDIPQRISVLETDNTSTKAALNEIQQNVRTMLSMMRQQ